MNFDVTQFHYSGEVLGDRLALITYSAIHDAPEEVRVAVLTRRHQIEQSEYTYFVAFAASKKPMPAGMVMTTNFDAEYLVQLLPQLTANSN